MKLVFVLLALAGTLYSGYQGYVIVEPIYKSYTPESTIELTELFEILKWAVATIAGLIVLSIVIRWKK